MVVHKYWIFVPLKASNLGLTLPAFDEAKVKTIFPLVKFGKGVLNRLY